MPTPLDVLFADADNLPPDILSDPARQELAAYSAYLDATVPAKRSVNRNLLIATWNICKFGSLTKQWSVPAVSHLSPKRDYRCLWAIADILSRFDIVAVQEVTGDLRALRYTMEILGPRWNFVMTDVSRGDAGNKERMAFLFDTSRVSLSGLACELVVPDEAEDYGFDPGAFKRQFARNPYAVSFRSGPTTIILVTAHIDFGDETIERLPEIRGIAKWLGDWAAQENRWHHNLMLLGDFNLDRSDNALYEAFVSTGLEVPYVLSSFPRTIYADPGQPESGSYHDQIAWFSEGDRALLGMEPGDGGSLEIFGRLLADLGLSKRSFATRISDHHPLWMEFRVSDPLVG
ncbi:MAG: endonuclease/exonuclease/phosphatase family protein [Notoacmeibacter sp.]|nr:endonuclease/exonuclease/phosphatase family protein [Notoacmeibacter sp.]MCC0032723.1 endonuclease/exonuclease/phosphatase family protein [Brucellaceae bacterium]